MSKKLVTSFVMSSLFLSTFAITSLAADSTTITRNDLDENKIQEDWFTPTIDEATVASDLGNSIVVPLDAEDTYSAIMVPQPTVSTASITWWWR